VRLILKRREPMPWKWRILLPPAAILFSVLISSLLIMWTDTPLWKVWWLILKGSLGSRLAIYGMLAKMCPLVFTGLGVLVAYKVGFWNIGGEGQLYAGGMAAAALGIIPVTLSPWVHIPLVLVGGFAAGALCAVVPAWFKCKLNVDDVVGTLLLNFVIILFVQAILDTVWLDPISGWPRSPEIAASATFPILIRRSQFHLGIALALAAAIIVWFVMRRTILGYRIRMTGANRHAAQFCGLPVTRVFLSAACVSGGLCGLAGVAEVCGVHGYLIGDISPGFGYYGIVVAMLAALSPLGVIWAALYFSVILTGAEYMSRISGVPIFFAEFIQGITLITMMVAMLFVHFRLEIRRSNRTKEAGEGERSCGNPS